MKINLSKNDYISQRENQYDDLNTKIHESFISCGPTAKAMQYKVANLTFENKTKFKDSDYLMYLLRSEEAVEYLKKHYKAFYDAGYFPNEVHYMYPEWLDKKLFGKKQSIFYESGLSFKKAISFMDVGKILMVSGSFPKAGIKGHIFCIIGYKNKKTLYLADPYGNYHTNYVDKNGYKIEMNEADFNKHLKWGHTKGYHITTV